MIRSSLLSHPKPGRRTILATWALLTISLSSCQSAVSPMEPSGEVLEVDPIAATLDDGDTLRIQARTKSGNGAAAALDPANQVTWISSAPGVAVVEEGLIRAIGPGEARITAVSVSGAAASARITVGSHGMIPAFPGAEGFGAAALSSCDRSRTHVFIVDDRGDSGPGTFREAMARAESAPDDELKAIVFKVGGYIHLTNGGVTFSGNCLYVAGQTAPGDGITLRGRRLEFDSDARDIVLRYFRMRPGAQDGDQEAIIVRKGVRYVFDHLSLSWTDGSLLRFTRTQIGRSGIMSDISVQHSLLGESLSRHPTAVSIGGEPKPEEENPAWEDHFRYSIHNNALVSNDHRNVDARGRDIEVINNVVHNWTLDAGQTGYGAIVDWVNNYFQKGPLSRNGYVPIGIRSRAIATTPYLRPSLHIAGNVSLGGAYLSDQNTSPRNDNWEGSTRMVGWYHNDTGNMPPSDFRRNVRISAKAPIPVVIRDPFDAYQGVLDDVGASKGLNCEGRLISRRDAVDQRLVQEMRLGTGANSIPADEGDAGGFPTLANGSACADSNGDGIPDAWMLANGLNPSGPSVSGRIGSRGYSYLEHYLNGTTP